MFIAFFALTERRIAHNLRDFCCCPPCARAPPLGAPVGPLASSPSQITAAAHVVHVTPPDHQQVRLEGKFVPTTLWGPGVRQFLRR